MIPRIVRSLLVVPGAGAGCSASGPARLATDAPLRYDPDNVERVRVVCVMEAQRVIVERADRNRYLLEIGNGCQQALQGAAVAGRVLVAPRIPSRRAPALALVEVVRRARVQFPAIVIAGRDLVTAP